MGKSCAIDLRVTGSNPAGQLLIYFCNVFPVPTRTLCRHSSLVPRSRIKAFVRKLRRCSPLPSPPPESASQLVSRLCSEFSRLCSEPCQVITRISFHYEYASAVMTGLIFLGVKQRDAIKHI